MTKKQIQVLSLLAAGIALELILMVGLLVNRGNSEQLLSTNLAKSILGGTKNNQTGSIANAAATDQAGGAYPSAESTLLPGSTADPAQELTLSAIALNPALTPEGTPEGVGPSGVRPEISLPPAADAGASALDPGFNPFAGRSGAYPPPGGNDPPPDAFDSAVPTATLAPTAATPTSTNLPGQPTPTHVSGQPTATTVAPTPVATATSPTRGNNPTPTSPPPPTATPVPGGGQPDLVAMLQAIPAQAAPVLDGDGNDAAWAGAPKFRVSTSGGANSSATSVTLQAVYDSQNVYFLLQWDDPTRSFLDHPWEKQADGSWKMLASPASGDENQFSEDKIALLWAAADMSGFTSQGCGSACHAGENSEAKPYGNMYTSGPRADLWQWGSVRGSTQGEGSGQMDDLYLDGTRYAPDTPAAGIHPDPSDGGGYRWNASGEKNAPAAMPPNGGDRSGFPGYILEAQKDAFKDKLFQPGERLPGLITAPFTGDRGDIAAAWQYSGGHWTLEIRRRLVTGSPYDIQFDDLNRLYYFGVATFDHTQVRHAAQDGAISFGFKK